MSAMRCSLSTEKNRGKKQQEKSFQAKVFYFRISQFNIVPQIFLKKFKIIKKKNIKNSKRLRYVLNLAITETFYQMQLICTLIC